MKKNKDRVCQLIDTIYQELDQEEYSTTEAFSRLAELTRTLADELDENEEKVLEELRDDKVGKIAEDFFDEGIQDYYQIMSEDALSLATGIATRIATTLRRKIEDKLK